MRDSGTQQSEIIAELRQQLVNANEESKHNAEQAILSGVQLINEKQKTQILIGLIEQMQKSHRDPKSSQYNKCDKPET
jgi:hypothetical protein